MIFFLITKETIFIKILKNPAYYIDIQLIKIFGPNENISKAKNNKYVLTSQLEFY